MIIREPFSVTWFSGQGRKISGVENLDFYPILGLQGKNCPTSQKTSNLLDEKLAFESENSKKIKNRD